MRSEIQLLISRIPLRAARQRPETLRSPNQPWRGARGGKGFEVRVRVARR